MNLIGFRASRIKNLTRNLMDIWSSEEKSVWEIIYLVVRTA